MSAPAPETSLKTPLKVRASRMLCGLFGHSRGMLLQVVLPRKGSKEGTFDCRCARCGGSVNGRIKGAALAYRYTGQPRKRRNG